MKKVYIADTGIVTYNGINQVVQICTTYTEDTATVLPITLEAMPATGQQCTIDHYYSYGGDMYKCSPTTTAESGDDYGGGGGGGMSTTAGHGGDGKVIVTYDIIENQLLNITAAYF